MIDIKAIKAKMFDIVGILFEVHNELGPGLNEYLYQEGLAMEFDSNNILYDKELSFHPTYKGKKMEGTYRLDFLIDGDIIIESKAVSELTDIHRSQLFNYLRLTRCPAGILVNFASSSCTIERYLYDYENRQILNIEGKPLFKTR